MTARCALHYAALLGEKDGYARRLLGVAKPLLPADWGLMASR